jgi:hypothetical protein
MPSLLASAQVLVHADRCVGGGGGPLLHRHPLPGPVVRLDPGQGGAGGASEERQG